MNLTVDDFDYPLPPELIAQAPLPERAASRLLVADGAHLGDRRIAELPELLAPGDLLVMNDSRVLHARLLGQKEGSGGQACGRRASCRTVFVSQSAHAFSRR